MLLLSSVIHSGRFFSGRQAKVHSEFSSESAMLAILPVLP